MDIKEITRRAREINPEIYVISVTLYNMPHTLLLMSMTGILMLQRLLRRNSLEFADVAMPMCPTG